MCVWVCVCMCVIEPTCGSDFLCGHRGKYTAKQRSWISLGGAMVLLQNTTALTYTSLRISIYTHVAFIQYDCSCLLKFVLCNLREFVFYWTEIKMCNLFHLWNSVSYPCSSWLAASPCWLLPLVADGPPSPPLYVYWSAWSPIVIVLQVTWEVKQSSR